MTGICGPSSLDSFAFYDPESSSLRTSQVTFDSGSTPCSPTLPEWGCMCGGELSERRTPELLTEGRGCSALLPTPTAMDSRSSGGSNPSHVTLTDAVVRTSLGARTNQRFGAGNVRSDGQRRGQLTIEDD